MIERTEKLPWRVRCRCGAPLSYSIEDAETHRPGEGADYWCSDPQPEKAPHDAGVITYDYNQSRDRTGLTYHAR